jgi:hypothetical protein
MAGKEVTDWQGNGIMITAKTHPALSGKYPEITMTEYR